MKIKLVYSSCGKSGEFKVKIHIFTTKDVLCLVKKNILTATVSSSDVECENKLNELLFMSGDLHQGFRHSLDYAVNTLKKRPRDCIEWAKQYLTRNNYIDYRQKEINLLDESFWTSDV